ncbi:MAG: CDP-diacylglycerol---glycerol-3-phosphate 3-phosphatidyltransferase [Actinomycetota bacterium]|nr:CDP-diacylglycerol---glycerol-3-phosphate 3-phosphatidyltransferase [Actinomycetota bacterium]
MIVALPAQDDSVIPARRTNSMRGRVASAGDTPASNGNVANIVTVIRILLVPVFVWLLFLDANGNVASNGVWRYIAAALFILAIATDGVDGKLARGRNLVTNVGIILDPIADKLLIGGALVSLSILGELWWWVTIVILVREVGITLFRFAVIRKQVIPASRGGKLKTVLQSVAISLFLVPFHALVGPGINWVNWVDYVFMAVALALTLYTGIDYLVQYARLNRASSGPATKA